ncbi:MAG TPA: malate dehydrogenase [Deltaproteobacteria bacterium]|nr:malate dehydrogenase [Deltaproteobacteria bacterium]
MDRPRILIIGAGMVGSSSAASMAARRLGAIFLYDSMEGLAEGRAMDINHSLPAHGSDSAVIGCNRLEEAPRSDIVVITAGMARQAGETRLDLLRHNGRVIRSLAPRIAEHSPEARVLLVTNPVDVLTWHWKALCPDMPVFGLGCALDTARFRFFLSRAAHVSVESVQGLVIGTHDDNMIPLTDYATIGGIPASTLLSSDAMDAIVSMTRSAGNTIVNLMKSHSGHYAAGEVVAHIAESVASDRGLTFPVSVCLSGEYGYSDTCLALPCILDRSGVREVIRMELNERDKTALDTCATSIATQIGSLA